RYFDGVVESIDNQVDPVSRSVTVRALLDNAAGHLQAGLLMEVVLQSNPRTALVVPESALVQQRDEHYLFVVREQGAGLAVEKTQVNIGVRLNGRVEVLAGVAAGDRIVVDGTLKLQDGVAISTLDRSPAMGD
ncbi:MAG: efflux RND transporter periplasmic adaptor subunit, partial [Ketobacter sp.]|nr:efflux RND transporter periplasmic adaptor subunit [Ketobacter sp.]